jgi:diguanylate cyclase (GGDEF)-like protein
VERLVETRDRCLAFLGHDLHGQLAVILGHCELLELGLLPPEHRRRSVETIRKQADQMATHVCDLLEVRRRGGDAGEDGSLGDVLQMCREVVDTFGPAAASRGRRIELASAFTAAPVIANRAAIREVIGVLLENAVRNSPDGGVVSVVVAVGMDDVEVRVTDDGPAYPANPYNTEALGKGAGLRGSARVLSVEGGTLRTGSVGGRALQSFTLPRAPECTEPRAVQVFGGDPERLEWMDEVLAPHVVVATSPLDPAGVGAPSPAALAAFVVDGASQPYAALAVYEALAREGRSGSTPIVLLLPPDEDVLARARELGCCEPLIEPLDPALLLDRLSRAIRLQPPSDRPSQGPRLDPLTGLPGAAAFEALVGPLRAAAQTRGQPLTVVVVRLDDLRGLNRVYGWSVGDQAILWLVAELRDQAEPGDLLARVASDAFVLLPSGGDSHRAALIVGELKGYLGRAKPRLGVGRVVAHARALAVDLARTGGSSVDCLLADVRTLSEVVVVA